MQDNAKYIADSIREIVERYKGFIAMSTLSGRMSRELKDKIGIKGNASASVIMKKIGPILEENFLLHTKGKALYVMIPREPEDFLLAELSPDKPVMPGELVRALKPFLKSEVIALVNEMIASGRVRVDFDERFMPQIFSAENAERVQRQPVYPGAYTREEFRAVYDELHKYREFVRICDVRRSLNWPREIFDEMVRTLRDNRTINLFRADESMLTKDEIRDCFTDENKFIMGIMTWNGR
ncbi:MAG: hypothetical protein IJS28_04405 [Synergistaceae bacterium]|nr:hypothetical protein [Synergistaceae bacterium]